MSRPRFPVRNQSLFGNNPSFRTGHFGTVYTCNGTISDSESDYWGVVAVKHVDGSICKDPEHCALANCFRDDPNVLDCRFVKTAGFLIFRNDPLHVVRYELEDDLQRQVRKFDKPGKGQPGVFFPLGEVKLSAPHKYLLGSGSPDMWAYISTGGSGKGERYPSRGE